MGLNNQRQEEGRGTKISSAEVVRSAGCRLGTIQRRIRRGHGRKLLAHAIRPARTRRPIRDAGLLAAAQAEADAISIKGKALRENPATIELSAIEKWNGVLPTITGTSAVPFVTVPQGK